MRTSGNCTNERDQFDIIATGFRHGDNGLN